ncbi:hypothetical protein [Beijerinckia indica]|uniref:Uncharacterized protein n=1 Tax=Beijerinckia indica subsp. indica (strain ATCC 9039 / DSM 1715 / NCIMB 8712) TaxID=395963 RepID=B2IHS7_BEII9|nr:hypothetical protein [Beijerinckia indica]ACB95970.1 hypothetical protein Bind_2358 [Beijerinckia indica subsp. indica ATCC 9039]
MTRTESENTPYERELYHMEKRDNANTRRWISSAVDILDTAKLVKLWFDDHAPNATAADIVAMTKLIINHHYERPSDVEIATATEELDSEY